MARNLQSDPAFAQLQSQMQQQMSSLMSSGGGGTPMGAMPGGMMGGMPPGMAQNPEEAMKAMQSMLQNPDFVIRILFKIAPTC